VPSAPMQGDGRYNRNSTAQAAAGDFGVPLLIEAAQAVPIPPDAFAGAVGPVVLADYGCSEGRNSLVPVGAAVDALRAQHGDDLQVLVLHTDLPGNDYSSLFRTIADDPLSYQRPGVFPVAAGRSYFQQLAPTGTVALGWSSIALHWLSAQPGPLVGIWPHLAPTSEQEAWRTHAAADWAAFLTARSAELVPGGRLVVVCGAAAPYGGSGAERVMQTLRELLRGNAVRGGVSADVIDRLSIPVWYRTEEEWRRPFAARSPQTTLLLEHFEIVRLGDPLWDQTRNGDPSAYARAVAVAVRVSFGPSLLAPVPADQREPLSARLFDDALATAISGQPAEPWFDWHLALLSISAPMASSSPRTSPTFRARSASAGSEQSR
jgi:SAM dependent carboxyl methyltransferase